MKLTKTSIIYKGKEYPCISIRLTDRESLKLLDDDIECRLFACRQLADDMGDEATWGKEEWDVDIQIDFYMATGEVERFHEGKTKVADMKATIKNIFQNW